MPNCTICTHPQREAIDRDLVSQKSFRSVSVRYGVSTASLHRHKNAHIVADLVEELLNYEIRINDNANAQFGAFRVGAHDDLATALGLACCEDLYYHHPSPRPHYDLMEEIDRNGSW